MLKLDPILYIDGYKVGHKFQYHPDTQLVYSNLTARSNKRAITLPQYIDEEIVWFGVSAEVQVMVQDFDENFFKRDVEEVVAKYKRRMDAYLGPDSVDTQHIRDLHELGYLPVAIMALPEGSIVPTRVPVLTIVNLDTNFYWLTNYLETYISAVLWQMQTSATTAFQYRCLLEEYAERTGSPKDFVLWQGHDFSFRGMPGVEAAARSGAAHLTAFLGTDTLPAIDYVEQYYKDGMQIYVGGSVPASEHSVASTNILFLEEKYKDSPNPKLEAEKEFFKRYITEIYPSGVASYVSDTYDFWGVLTEIAPALKEEILNRKPNHLGLAKVVFRPDSGDPVKIICGETIPSVKDTDEAIDYLIEQVREETPHGELGEDNPSGLFKLADGKIYKVSVFIEWNRHDKRYYYMDGNYGATSVPVELTPEQKGAVEVLWDTFGGTITSTGHKLLNQRVGLIYGDSITLERATEILQNLEAKGFASANVVFGVGSFTYQHNTRDTHGWAIKSTYTVIGEKEIKVFKDPKTDDGTKKSAKGICFVRKNSEGVLELIDDLDTEQLEKLIESGEKSEMQTIMFGKQIRVASYQDIRIRINQEVEKRVRKVIDKQ